MEGIHVLYKNLGETPLQCVERFKVENPEMAGVSMTYAGRLDPMAEGLLLVLSGDAIQEKEKYLGLPKTYVCEILWGVETDTLDVLGFLTKVRPPSVMEVGPSLHLIQEVLENSKGKFEQVYPAYSSKPVMGTGEGIQGHFVSKPLFEWAREGKLDQIEIPKHQVEIFESQYVSRRNVLGKELLKEILSKISLVSGDFRQQEIEDKWREFLTEHSAQEFTLDTISMTVSSGFYVRQFVHDFAEKLGTVATTFHIKRTQIGDFHIDL